MDDWIGKQLAQYQISRQIGRGGMAVVYQAWQPALGRHVAIKLLPPQFTLDQQFLARFRREARSAAQLKHPHIVTIYDVGEQDGIHFIVMEYLEGQSLYELIKATGPMSLERAARIASQVAAALDYAHQRGFVHRDIKPANIIVGPNDHATLTDFGIAKALLGTSLTQSGMMIGTPQYMAPEQIQGAEVDSRTDVYALGIVCYEMLTGVPPFVGDTAAVLYAQAHTPPPALRAQLPDLPDHVEAAVNRALAKDPAARFERAGALADALSSRTALVPPSPTLPPPTVRTPAPQPTPSRRPLWILVGSGAVAAVLAVCLLLFMLVRDGQEEATPTAVARVTDTPAEATTRPTMTNPPPTAPPSTTTPTSPPPTTAPASRTPTATPTPVSSDGLVAYAAGPNGAWQIFITNPTSGETWLLAGQLPNSGVPAWSPTGERLAFRSNDSGTWQIYTIDVDGTDLRQLTHTGNNYEANWSPDGEQIAFISDRDGDKEVYVMDSNGGNQRRLTFNPGWDDDPNWSPDGQWLVFESERQDRVDVYRMRTDGSNLTRLTYDGDSNSTPAWSPDGQWIAFERRSGSIYHIWVMDAAGGDQWQLTPDGDQNLRPAWSPDASEIAYNSDRGGVEAVWIISLDPSRSPRRLSPGAGFDAAWSRR